MKLSTVILLLALVSAPACGGGSGTDPGGSPSPLAASFVPDEPAPTADTVAMAEGARSNDVVTINVTLTDASGVFAAAFDVAFDDTHTVYLGYTHGSVVEQGDSNPTYSVGTDVPGSLVIAVSHTGSTTTNVSGTSTVIGLQFRVKHAGVFPLVIEHEVVFDGQDPPQPVAGVSWFAGAVTGV